MRRVLGTIFAMAAVLPGQSPPEKLSAWRYVKEIPAQGTASSLLLDKETLDKARQDGADIRLYDRANREIPYLFRILRDVETSQAFPAREFNRSVEGGVAQVSLDLGDTAQEHNQVEIETAGSNFRRLVDVQGSVDGANWSTMVEQAILFRFAAGGRTVQQETITYPVSRYRYLRVRVGRDPQTDNTAPEITRVNVVRSVRVRGETTSFPGLLEGREADRVNSRAGSIWRIDLGARVPIQSLAISTTDSAFSRPFQVEGIDDPSTPVLIASGTLTRSEDSGNQPANISFAERFARRLKLTITDDRNQPLSLIGVTAAGAARQLMFAAVPADSFPLRMYYGNPKAPAPHYDFSGRPPAAAGSVPRLVPGPERENPIYSPEPKPLSERAPWLVYVVLAAASLILAAILVNLVRMSAKKEATA